MTVISGVCASRDRLDAFRRKNKNIDIYVLIGRAARLIERFVFICFCCCIHGFILEIQLARL